MGPTVTGEQAAHGNIFIKGGPVNAFTPANQPPIGAVGIGRIAQTGKPGKWDGELAAIIEADAQAGAVDDEVDSQRSCLKRQSAHADILAELSEGQRGELHPLRVTLGFDPRALCLPALSK